MLTGVFPAIYRVTILVPNQKYTLSKPRCRGTGLLKSFTTPSLIVLAVTHLI